MKVVFKKTIVSDRFRFRAGQEAELSDDMETEFLNAGFCDVIAEAPKQRAKKAVKKSTKKQTR